MEAVEPRQAADNHDHDHGDACAPDTGEEKLQEEKPQVEKRGPPRVPDRYPETLPELPTRPNYDEMNGARQVINAAMREKRERIRYLNGKINGLSTERSATSLQGIDQETKDEYKAARAAFDALVAKAKDARARIGAIDDQLRQLREDLGKYVGYTAAAFDAEIERLNYEYDHTTMTPAEEREERSRIGKLQALGKRLPDVEQLRKTRDELREADKALKGELDAARAARDAIQKRITELREKNDAAYKSKSNISATMQDFITERNALGAELDAMKTQTEEMYAKYRTQMFEFTKAERSRVHAERGRSLLRRMWEPLLDELRRRKVHVAETAPMSGKFTVSKYVVTSVENIGYDEASARKEKLCAWCRVALKTDTYGVNKAVKKGKKTILEVDFELVALLKAMGVDSQRVTTREGVEGLLAEYAGESSQRQEARIAEANSEIERLLKELEALHATITLT